MERARELFTKYREQILYLFFGGVTTAINLAVYALAHFGLGLSSDIANAIAWVLSVLAAYLTNRRWVFCSHTVGTAMLRELGGFVAARVATGAMDMGVMHLGVEVLGPRLAPAGMRPLWDMGVKLLSNVLVIVMNYVFSKLWIFKKRDGR